MSVLLIRLAGPMQAWGTQSRFSHRDTGLEPSKSGVIGIVGAALGVARHDQSSIARLAALRMAVRIDCPGSMDCDYHTAMDVRKADGSKPPEGQAVLSDRYFLADAEFLVGLEGEQSFLKEIDAALREPIWPIFLGRKSFVPSKPLFVEDGIREGELLEVMESFPIEASERKTSEADAIRLVYDVAYGKGDPRQDVPISFEPRRFGVRHVDWKFIHPPLVEVTI